MQRLCRRFETGAAYNSRAIDQALIKSFFAYGDKSEVPGFCNGIHFFGKYLEAVSGKMLKKFLYLAVAIRRKINSNIIPVCRLGMPDGGLNNRRQYKIIVRFKVQSYILRGAGIIF